MSFSWSIDSFLYNNGMSVEGIELGLDYGLNFKVIPLRIAHFYCA